MKTTAANIIRLAGLAAMGSGILFVAIQAIHPLDVLSSVGAGTWTLVHYMGVAMGILGIFGVTGIYARQIEESDWLGLIGYLLLTLFYVLTTAFQFIEAFITPMLVTDAPGYVESFLALAAGKTGPVDLGGLPTAYAITGMAGYLLGGALFGIATFRARVLPRWAAVLLIVSVVLPLATSGLIPHPYDRILAVPMAVALGWLGYALWSERRTTVSQSSAERGTAQLHRVGVK